MKRIIVVLLLVSILPNITDGEVRRALLVGIGNYPENSGWSKINGDKDVVIVREMLLYSGFDEGCIVTLTDSQATKEGIISQMDKLISECRKGDVVYIHFSGHGQQVTDIDGDEVEREADGFDEAWIPYDACIGYQMGVYEGEKHILDDELYVILSALRGKVGVDGRLIVVADACHSGDSTRGDEDDVFRGTTKVFEIPDSVPSEIGRKAMGKPEQAWVLVSACKSFQVNFESREGYGMLSTAVVKCAEEFRNGSFLTWFSALSDYMKENCRRPQTPIIEGEDKYLQLKVL